MIKLAAVALVLAALLGGLMASRHFRKKSIPWALPVIHGLLAATGLVLLGIALFSGSVPAVAWLAFGILLLAAMGGAIVFRDYLRHQRLSSGMIVIHAMVAVLGLLFLILFLIARGVVRESRNDRRFEDNHPPASGCARSSLSVLEARRAHSHGGRYELRYGD